MKVNKRFLIFFGLLLVTNIIHYSQTNLEILLDKIISDGSIGLIFFILYSFSGTRHQCQVEKFASFLDVYIRRENYIKSNKISDFDEKLKSFNQDLSMWKVKGTTFTVNMFLGSPLENRKPKWEGH